MRNGKLENDIDYIFNRRLYSKLFDVVQAVIGDNMGEILEKAKFDVGYLEGAVSAYELYDFEKNNNAFKKSVDYEDIKASFVDSNEYLEYVREQYGDGEDAGSVFDNEIENQLEELLSDVIEGICEASEDVVRNFDNVYNVFDI